MPYHTARLTHHEHQKHANDPELGPDIHTRSDSPWHMVWKEVVDIPRTGSATGDLYGACLQRLGTAEAKRAGLASLIYELTFNGLLFAFAWAGYAIEAAAVWWLPRIIGVIYIRFYLSRLGH